MISLLLIDHLFFFYSKLNKLREYHEVLIEEYIPGREIQAAIMGVKKLGAIKYLLNTSGKSYREIGSAKIKSMTDSQVIKLIEIDSKLIKRPFVYSNGLIIVGFNDKNWKNFFCD